jgi:hypothetical protein
VCYSHIPHVPIKWHPMVQEPSAEASVSVESALDWEVHSRGLER